MKPSADRCRYTSSGSQLTRYDTKQCQPTFNVESAKAISDMDWSAVCCSCSPKHGSLHRESIDCTTAVVPVATEASHPSSLLTVPPICTSTRLVVVPSKQSCFPHMLLLYRCNLAVLNSHIDLLTPSKLHTLLRALSGNCEVLRNYLH
jgi:hypothetical protein